MFSVLTVKQQEMVKTCKNAEECELQMQCEKLQGKENKIRCEFDKSANANAKSVNYCVKETFFLFLMT